jgi:D-alanyl-D-alanine carboxypeptidase/D-alanyl-D-alanine-endopeptidase (penicillin-binding protein 4)
VLLSLTASASALAAANHPLDPTVRADPRSGQLAADMKHPIAAVVALLVTALVALPVDAVDRDRLVYHVETLDGEEVTSHEPDHPFNPASVVKVGTSLWALDQLGSGHRYPTDVGFRGAWTEGSDTIAGDLVVRGGNDPDFHVENALLIARTLNELGIVKVTGSVVVTGNLWFGWEHGEAARELDATKRGAAAARRLRSILDRQRWSHSTLSAWRALAKRRGWPVGQPPSVRLTPHSGYEDAAAATWLLVHRSNPLPSLLRRFDVYSNNDIVRVADPLGGAHGLASFLTAKLGLPASAVELSTASGEEVNRMSPRTVVAMLRTFHYRLGELGLSHRQVLPVLGCDDGPSRRMFPTLSTGPWAGAITVKTGTLTTTDGGVAVLAGQFCSMDRGDVIFCVAAERAGGNLRRWRAAEQSWLVDLVAAVGGAIVKPCGPPLLFPDSEAQTATVSRVPVTG